MLKTVLKDKFQVNDLQAVVLQAEGNLFNIQQQLHLYPSDPVLVPQECT